MLSLKGCYTAIITPFKNGKIDYEAYKKIIEHQVTQGIDGIVVAGTTGESPTLSFSEHQKLMEFTINSVNKRCLVITGTGANSTDEAVELTKFASKAGADASLQVTPYYNKPTQKGLLQHFNAITESCDIPIILYNVPGRAGLALDISTVQELAKKPNIVAIKEAAGSVDRVSQILSTCDITVLSGDDLLTLPMLSVGATGAISVLSNAYPKPMTELIHLALNNQWGEARKIHYKFYKLMNAIFIETNPLPIKTLMAKLDYCQEEFRLPLCSMNSNTKKQLLDTLTSLEK